MSIRILLAAAGLLVAGCGGSGPGREVRLLAPVGYAEDLPLFERSTGCEVDARIYDQEEDVVAIARRRDVDAVAGTDAVLDRLRGAGEELRDVTRLASEELVELTLEGAVTVTVPRELASPLEPRSSRPAGRRTVSWALRAKGDNRDCARRWVAYATSQ